jgi:hypothetical protein
MALNTCAPKGQESTAQGLPWISRKQAFCPEAAGNTSAIRFKGSEPILAVLIGPFSFRAHSGAGN